MERWAILQPWRCKPLHKTEWLQLCIQRAPAWIPLHLMHICFSVSSLSCYYEIAKCDKPDCFDPFKASSELYKNAGGDRYCVRLSITKHSGNPRFCFIYIFWIIPTVLQKFSPWVVSSTQDYLINQFYFNRQSIYFDDLDIWWWLSDFETHKWWKLRLPFRFFRNSSPPVVASPKLYLIS